MTIIGIRQSQIVSTYGPGALVDLPHYAVLVAGLEHWAGDAQLVPEPRLLANLRRRLGLPALELRSPPVPEREDEQGIGIIAGSSLSGSSRNSRLQPSRMDGRDRSFIVKRS